MGEPLSQLLRYRRVRRGWRLRRLGPVAALAGVLALGVVSAVPRVTAQVTREYDLKAVFLYNLASFVEWPSSAFAGPDAPFVIGVLGDDPFGPVLDQVLANEYVGTRRIVPRRFRRNEDFAQCHVLFVSASEKHRLRDVWRRLGSRPVLTVGEGAGFVEEGGMVAFGLKGQHLILYVNPPAARTADLVISSKLLEVAEVVDRLASSP